MKILIATDGSEFSRAAVDEFGQNVLKPTDEIKIVAAADPLTHVIGAPFGVVDEYYQKLINEARKQASEITGEAEAQIRRIHPHPKLTTRVLLGSPAQSIVEEAEKWDADLIVVGSHGYGFWKRALLGSVSSAVVNHAPCSVLVVRKPESVNGKAE
jgi:nucleotide-binding universal stress UspA family protein